MTATQQAAIPRVREVADGVYAYTHSRGGWCVSNAGVLTGPDGAPLTERPDFATWFTNDYLASSP